MNRSILYCDNDFTLGKLKHFLRLRKTPTKITRDDYVKMEYEDGYTCGRATIAIPDSSGPKIFIFNTESEDNMEESGSTIAKFFSTYVNDVLPTLEGGRNIIDKYRIIKSKYLQNKTC